MKKHCHQYTKATEWYLFPFSFSFFFLFFFFTSYSQIPIHIKVKLLGAILIQKYFYSCFCRTYEQEFPYIIYLKVEFLFPIDGHFQFY